MPRINQSIPENITRNTDDSSGDNSVSIPIDRPLDLIKNNTYVNFYIRVFTLLIPALSVFSFLLVYRTAMNSTGGDIEASLDFIRSMNSRDILILNIEIIVLIFICSISVFTIPIISLRILGRLRYSFQDDKPVSENDLDTNENKNSFFEKSKEKINLFKFLLIIFIIFIINFILFSAFAITIPYKMGISVPFFLSLIMLIPDGFVVFFINDVYSPDTQWLIILIMLLASLIVPFYAIGQSVTVHESCIMIDPYDKSTWTKCIVINQDRDSVKILFNRKYNFESIKKDKNNNIIDKSNVDLDKWGLKDVKINEQSVIIYEVCPNKL